MKPSYPISLFVMYVFTWVVPQQSVAQLPKDLTDYVCKNFKGLEMELQFRPVKFLEQLFPKDVSSSDVYRIDSLNTYGDTIYFLRSDFNDLIDYHSVSQEQADEMIAAIISFAKKGKTGKLECIPLTPTSGKEDLAISFSQPVFTKDRMMCLIKYDVASIDDKSSHPYRQRDTLFLKFVEGKWVDQQVLTLRHSELRD